MLVGFNFGNFKCFRDVQSFSMIAGPTKMEEELLFRHKNSRILKFTAIYGANGSGKSNSIKAIEMMRFLFLSQSRENVMPFYYKLDSDYVEKPSYFEVVLILDGHSYSYGFEYSSLFNKFESEWLVNLDTKEEIEIFSRNIDEGTYSLSTKEFSELKSRMHIYLDDIKTNKDVLLLASLGKSSNPVLNHCKPLKDVFNWFVNSLVVVEPENRVTSNDYFVLGDKMNSLKDLLVSFDTGIKSIAKKEVSAEVINSLLPPPIIEKIKVNTIRNAKANNENKFCSLMSIENDIWQLEFNKDIFKYYKICFYHDDKKQVPFSMSEESNGTIRLIDLAEVLLTDAKDKLFIIDELDCKLHPILTRKFVKMFKERNKNTNNQLIVTTHEVSLMNLNLLRRDEIWFTDKKEDGHSNLYSLEEYKIRFDKKIDNDYLDGRFGAIPHFTEEESAE